MRLALSVVCAVALCAAAHLALRSFGAAAGATLTRDASGAFTTSVALMLAYALGAIAAGLLLARIKGPFPTSAVLAIVAAIYVGIGYPRSMRLDPLNHFGALSTPPPNSAMPESYPGRPKVTYRLNEHGFREPSFQLAKAEGSIRVALLGDSFVFGSGVEQDETLSARLAAELGRRAPDRRFEVLNLGIAGNNIESHVDMYETAVARLDPDVVVLCLTLPNDLSRWDGQIERRDARAASAFSAARFFIGEAAILLWNDLSLEALPTRAGLAHLERQLGRVTRLRGASPARPGLVLFTFWEIERSITAVLERSGLTIAEVGEREEENFIPGDGHPTAKGNRRFATWVADGIQSDKLSARLIAAAPPR